MLTLTKTTILNVDDHEAGRYARSRALRNAGFEVLEASSGAEALQLVNSRRPPLVLLDINLPDMTGYDVCRQIKTASATSGILVLHVSATFVKGSDQKRGLEGGADGYLAEPVDPDVLVATVNAYLRLRSAEEALRESEERFRAAFEDAPIGMALVNFDHRIFRANRALAEMLGYRPEELMSLTIDELGLPEETEKNSLPLRQLFTGELDGYQLERRCRNKKRNVIWINLIGRAVRNADGKILYGLVMAENISERKRSEEERERLLAAEQKARSNAEAANRAKDQFLATVSHELRTPLGAILGWARILRNQVSDPQTTARGLEAIERNATAQAQLIEDILDVSRIISGKLRLIPQAVDFISVVRAALESIKPAVEARRIRIETRLNVPAVSVRGDPSRLQQVIWNLLSNAVKFSPEGGQVQVGLELVDPHHVEVSVVDAGHGIPAAFLPHMFEPFRQADATTTRRYGGLGLGLSIVKQLVELHGGTIEAVSEGEGKGATLKLRLPLADQFAEVETVPKDPETTRQRSRPELPMKLPRVLEGIKVLVVDDEADARDLLDFILQKAGATVELAASTGEALALLDISRPTILVADIGMPGEDGYELIRRVRALSQPDLALLPAMALTAYARAEERAQAFSAGFQSHMTKPVEPSELIATIARMLEEAGKLRRLGQSS
jgi:PAS domain S-box-containing protein